MSQDSFPNDPLQGPVTPAAPAGPPPGPPPPEPAMVEDSGAQALAEALRSSFGIVKFFMVLLVAAFVFSGLFTVAPNEVAVLLRFGRPVGVGLEQLRQPGLHWKLPYPIDEVVFIPVGETRTVTSTTGWYAITPEQEIAGGIRPEEAGNTLIPGVDGYALANDGNIIHVRATVNYRISDPLRYAFEFVQPTNLLQHVLDNALLYAARQFNADQALYQRRDMFRETVARRLRDSVELLQLGVELDPREVRIDPPLYVQRAFNEVIESQQRRDTRIREAETYARGVTNRAIGEASAVVQNGLTRSNTLVQAVATDATNFMGLLPSWQSNPRLLHERLLAETSQRVLTNAAMKVYLPARADGRPRELRLQLSRDIEPPRRPESPTTR
jgi:modulator of FtsH protease HflK